MLFSVLSSENITIQAHNLVTSSNEVNVISLGQHQPYTCMSSVNKCKYRPCFWIVNTRSTMYSKSSGPRTEPCRTLNAVLSKDDCDPEWTAHCCCPVKYELIQSRAMPLMLYDTRRQCSNMLWSTVSNAADKSKRASTTMLPPASGLSMSENIFVIAISVEWHLRYAACAQGSRLLIRRCLSSQREWSAQEALWHDR